MTAMTCDMTVAEMRRHMVLQPAALAAAISRLAAEGALGLPLLDEPLRCGLLDESEALTYRPAKPSIGQEERIVYQDFELCMELPEESPFRRFAAALDDLMWAALGEIQGIDCPGFTNNDLILQRYLPGCGGITPHRDHIRYGGLVSLVILAGEADFYISEDRQGTNPRLVPSPPGCLLLMRGAGFAGLRDRPFHQLRNIRSFRVSFGLRYDQRPGDPL